MLPEVVFCMPPAPRQKQHLTAAQAAGEHAHEKQEARWHWVQQADGSRVAERHEADATRLLAYTDLYGAPPLLPTGAHMRSVSSVLTELVGKLELKEAEIAPELLTQAWKQADGDFLASHTQLIGLTEGRALISANHPAVRFELQRHTKDIIAALNRTLGEGCVQAVRLVHG